MRVLQLLVAPASSIQDYDLEDNRLKSNGTKLANMDVCARRSFRTALLRWFDANKRALPWRKDKDPYRVWISEIMLQQTRVAAVTAYYERFMQRFPNVLTLARARESSVLTAWSGLGYYRRARALHATAKVVVSEHGGAFPGSSEALRNLPGIGRYTAAAIASIAFGEPCALVDGNVERVLARVTGVAHAREDVWQLANELLSPRRPGDFNEAMMELGATVCTPKDPRCGMCPISHWCCTKGVLNGSKQETRLRREARYALSARNGEVYLVKRAASASLMPGMWELPQVEGKEGEPLRMSLKHSITTTDYTVRVVHREVANVPGGGWVPFRQVARLPLTGLARKILKRAEII